MALENAGGLKPYGRIPPAMLRQGVALSSGGTASSLGERADSEESADSPDHGKGCAALVRPDRTPAVVLAALGRLVGLIELHGPLMADRDLTVMVDVDVHHEATRGEAGEGRLRGWAWAWKRPGPEWVPTPAPPHRYSLLPEE